MNIKKFTYKEVIQKNLLQYKVLFSNINFKSSIQLKSFFLK
jgi:hypothetical protein